MEAIWCNDEKDDEATEDNNESNDDADHENDDDANSSEEQNPNSSNDENVHSSAEDIDTERSESSSRASEASTIVQSAHEDDEEVNITAKLKKVALKYQANLKKRSSSWVKGQKRTMHFTFDP